MKGFTLLEVLVALTIIAVALAASMRGAMSLTANAEDTRLKLLATIEAQNRLLELRLAHQSLAVGQTQYDCEQGGIKMSCEQNIKSTPNPFFRRVEVRVSRAEADNPRLLVELLTVMPAN
ncbi:MAG TPA: type II secretion system minor pseudopilin GspI [Burkholderiaceae bacterium]|nr:type II secretion system minor pseudopilin GspI [Burkholderiaceae bacterium]